MFTYKQLYDGKQQAITGVQRNDGLCIPLHPDNADYQEYLKWVAEGNTPEPAENT
jgi:hypothetical protein